MPRSSRHRSAPARPAPALPASLPEHEHHAAEDSSEPIHSDSMGLERLVFFSDAVFAIAITLLALEIRLPAGSEAQTNLELLDRLLALWPTYLSYGISFLVIGTFWIAHHAKFRVITRYDGRLMFLNLLQLMVVAFIPFPTSVLSEYGNLTATIFYAATIVVAGLLSTVTWVYALHNNRLVPSSMSREQAQVRLWRSLLVPGIFLLSIGIAFINDEAARYSWLLLVVVAILR